MCKISRRLSLIIGVLLIAMVFGLLFGTTILARHALNAFSQSLSHTRISPQHASITLPRGQELFVPFLLVVPRDTIVTWQNEDTVTHRFTTTPQKNAFLNPQTFSFRVPAGGQAQFTFSRPGLYHYYDTGMSTWNLTLERVAAHKGTPHFPLAMDGIIWVQGPLNNLPTNASNHIPKGHDEFASEFVAISQPGTVTWHNFDEDPHFVGLVAGWPAPINPTDIGLYRFAGTDDVPGGASNSVLFDIPGLYYYYCRNHDQVDPLTHRARALPMASEYPIPMEGFVLVI